MQEIINGIFSKLLLVIGMAAIFTGASFAQVNSANPESDNTKYENARRSLKMTAKSTQLRAGNIVNAKGKYASAENQANFNVGTNFVLAVLSAERLNESRADFDFAIVDLVYLIDSLEGTPEAPVLQKTLKSIIRGTGNSSQVSKEIIEASISYAARLNKEQLWYYSTGMTVTNLLFDVYQKDDAAIKESLSRIQSVLQLAPEGTSEEIIRSMQKLVNYISQATFADGDYNGLMDGVAGVANSINA